MIEFLHTPLSKTNFLTYQQASLLEAEWRIETVEDFLLTQPHRYEDRTQFATVEQLMADYTKKDAQMIGKIIAMQTVGVGKYKKRLVAQFVQGNMQIELIWFSAVTQVQNIINRYIHQPIVIYGKVERFRNQITISHPRIEIYTKTRHDEFLKIDAIYPSSAKLKKMKITDTLLRRTVSQIIQKIRPQFTQDTLPQQTRDELKLYTYLQAIYALHFPKTMAQAKQALRRLKFEELFYAQLSSAVRRYDHDQNSQGLPVLDDMEKTSNFTKNHIPFTLTGAQRRVLADIHGDLISTKQMNRLIQGDVGSGKTMVAFIAQLMVIDSGYQTAIIAPTEILATQHFINFSQYANKIGLRIELLKGSRTKKQKEEIAQQLHQGEIDIIVGTHALLEDYVQFKKLGMVVIDEQHRFGVEQREKLWRKSPVLPPHVLIMTATPIPRTLTMAMYGDLDVSIIDELPPGRKPIETRHMYSEQMGAVYNFLDQEIKKGRQAYMVYPLIEESEALDLKHVQQGFEDLERNLPQYQIAMLHGRMKNSEKDEIMNAFKEKKYHILVSTTVIEVGVDVPNASVMVIEEANRFGLSQLHQIRGRVGRGGNQSYCLLLTDHKLSAESKVRIKAMVDSQDGFYLAEVDLKLRGAGNVEGVQQSGNAAYKISNISTDLPILQEANRRVNLLLESDPLLREPQHLCLHDKLKQLTPKAKRWSKIG